MFCLLGFLVQATEAQQRYALRGQHLDVPRHFFGRMCWAVDAKPGERVITPDRVCQYQVPDSPLVLGLQGNLWTVRIRTEKELLYMAFPRVEAPAVKCRTAPVPERRDGAK